jgi:tetratricopeptide (TPR) repeat protein
VLELGYHKEAAGLAEIAVQRAPFSDTCYSQLAQALARDRRQHQRAREAARRALDLAPNRPLSHVAAGNIELHAGQKAEARRHYRRALELDPTDAAAQTNLAILSGAQRNFGHALGSLQALLAVEPGDTRARELFDRFIQTAAIDLLWAATFAALILAGIRH